MSRKVKTRENCHDCDTKLFVKEPATTVMVIIGEADQIAVCIDCYNKNYKDNKNVTVALPYSIHNGMIFQQCMMMETAVTHYITCDVCKRQFNQEQVLWLIGQQDRVILKELKCKNCRKLMFDLRNPEEQKRVFTPKFAVKFIGFNDEIINAHWNPNDKEMTYEKMKK